MIDDGKEEGVEEKNGFMVMNMSCGFARAWQR